VRKVGWAIFLISSAIGWARAQSSVLASGDWYKISIAQDGIYKIDYPLLQKMGINPTSIDPKKIQLFTGQPGMLPQSNSTQRINDLKELAIYVSGESDGKFDAGDYILFFGLGPDTFRFDTQKNFVEYVNNIYSDKNFYFLTISNNAGKRANVAPFVEGSFPVINQFDDFGYYENEKYNLLHSGRQWFGEQFDQFLTATFSFDMPGIVENTPIQFTSHVMAQSITNCSFQITYNNTSVLTQPIPAIVNSSFATKGNIKADTILLNSNAVNATQSSQQIKYQFTKGSPGISVGYLDYILFTCIRKLALYGSQTIFTSLASVANAASTFQITSSVSGAQIWEVTDLFDAKIQSTAATGNQLTFSTETSSLKKFVVFNPASVTTPSFEKKIANQNLHQVTSADLIIISYPDWKDQAARLANHRLSSNQLTSVVVTTEQIFNEYAGGKGDVTALRDFIRDVYQKSNGELKYVLLFGRGSYDYKDRVYANTNFVPIYESVNSLDPLATYSSDDYYGFLDDNEGTWQENPPVDNLLNIGIGRLPVKSVSEAKTVVDKLIDYDKNENGHGPWRKKFLFVADDGDFNIHQTQSSILADNIESLHPEFDSKKILLSNYTQINKPSGQISPQASKALDLTVRQGAGIVNYTGHGSEQVWTQEQILTGDLVDSWKNGPRYPLFVTATCEFGRNEDPSIISSAEKLILNAKGGGIGLVTTARPVYSNSNFQLNQAFYQALFTKTSGIFRNLGDIFKDTKNNSLSGVGNRNFSLLGDPSMTLAFGNDNVVVNKVKTVSGSDTLKANSQVVINGEIQKQGVQQTSFNGTIYASLFDKLQNLVTPGDPNETVNPTSPPFNFTERKNKLFEGSASVQNGLFEFNFDMPSNLVANFNYGKLSLYATSESFEDALGYSENFVVGGTDNSTPDSDAPQIKLYIGDTTFVNGGTVGPNTQLVGRLIDKDGINISSQNSANNMIATLDDKWSYVVNDYYFADKNNPEKGMVIYPLDTLKAGAHKLTLTASDTHNNIATASVNFVVSDGNGIVVGDFYGYPNPFNSNSGKITFHFTHTRSGEDLDASIALYDITGQFMTEMSFEVTESSYQVDLGEWNGENSAGTKFPPGLYVAKLSVRSLSDGSKNERSTKLIIVN
jgi:hypothetical protein